jgi:hypothetical protein
MAWPPPYVSPLVFMERDGNMYMQIAYKNTADGAAALRNAVNGRMALLINDGLDPADLTVDIIDGDTWGFIRQRNVGIIFTAMCYTVDLE